MRVEDFDMTKTTDANFTTKERKIWPRNSVKHYRQKYGWTQQEVIQAINQRFNTSFARDTLRKIENRERKLNFEWAERIGEVLSVPPSFIAFGGGVDDYSWAVKSIPVVGFIDADMRVQFHEHPVRRIGKPHATPHLRAIEVGPHSIEDINGWLFIYDISAPEKLDARFFEQQEAHKKFLVELEDGSMWQRQARAGAKRHHYHLDAPRRPSITDVEIKCVYEIRDSSMPGSDVPDFD